MGLETDFGPDVDSDLDIDCAKPALDSAKVLEMIGPGGLLTQHLPAFQPRAGQQSMMKCVLEAYDKSAIALIEAGTGIGKSIAYLLPAILWAAKTGERTVISTHTIPLQEQLFQKDLPLLLKALGLEMQVSLVKGMGNYICLRKWGHVINEAICLPTKRTCCCAWNLGWIPFTKLRKSPCPCPCCLLKRRGN